MGRCGISISHAILGNLLLMPSIGKKKWYANAASEVWLRWLVAGQEGRVSCPMRHEA